MSDIKGQVQITFGPSRSGKSYTRVRWVINTFLHEPWQGLLVTNLPLEVDKIADKFQAEYEAGKHQITGETVRARIIVIPVEWRREWMAQNRRDFRSLVKDDDGRPAWSPFKLINDLLPKEGNFHLLLDEIHNFYSEASTKEWAAEWQTFFDEISHEHGTVEIMTQAVAKVPSQLKQSVEIRRDICSSRTRPDGMFGIPFQDWYNLRAAFTRVWASSCWVLESFNNGSAFANNPEEKVIIDGRYFPFYDSRNAPERAESHRKGGDHEPWENLSRFGVVRWFWRKNSTKLIFSKFVLLAGILVFTLCGGVAWALNGFLSEVRSIATESANGIVADGKPKKEPVHKESQPDPSGEQRQLAVASGLTPAPLAYAPEPPEQTVLDVQLVDPQGIWFDGIYTMEGETLPTGTAAGLAVTKLDYKRGLAYLSDGTVLRLQGISASAEASGGMAGSVRRLASSSVEAIGRRGGRSAGDGTGVESSDTGTGPVPRTTARPVHGGVSGVRGLSDQSGR